MEQDCTSDLTCLPAQLGCAKCPNATSLYQPLQQLLLGYVCEEEDILDVLAYFLHGK